jgi:hypothetical protein
MSESETPEPIEMGELPRNVYHSRSIRFPRRRSGSASEDGGHRRLRVPKRTLGVAAMVLIAAGGVSKAGSVLFWDKMQGNDQKVETAGIDQQRLLGARCLKGRVVLGPNTVILKTPREIDSLHVPVVGHLPGVFEGNVKHTVAKGEELAVRFPRLNNVDGRTVMEFTLRAPEAKPPAANTYASSAAIARQTYQVVTGLTEDSKGKLQGAQPPNLLIYPSSPNASEATTTTCKIAYNGTTLAAGSLAAFGTVNPNGSLMPAGTFQAMTGRNPLTN